MKPDAVLNKSCISVAEAKNRGYYIPDNYKEDVVPTLNFSNVDEVLRICAKNNLKLRYHTLVWHSQSPDWFFRTGYSTSGVFVSPEVMDARMEFYIRSVMEHVYNSEYGYVVYAWDVVNEYFHSDDRNWIAVYGKVNLTPRHIKLAYEIADDVLRDYGIRDKVSLIFNDYNTFQTYGVNVPNSLISIINYINSDGKICDGIGMQTHLDINWPSVDECIRAVNLYLNEGYEVQITEMDLTVKNQSGNGEELQAKYYCKLLTELLKIKSNGGNITGITFWGMGDSASWLKEHSPLLFERAGEPKDSYYQVLQAYLDAGYTME
jgi:endo-1,4-beta-xylanase